MEFILRREIRAQVQLTLTDVGVLIDGTLCYDGQHGERLTAVLRAYDTLKHRYLKRKEAGKSYIQPAEFIVTHSGSQLLKTVNAWKKSDHLYTFVSDAHSKANKTFKVKGIST